MFSFYKYGASDVYIAHYLQLELKIIACGALSIK